MIFLDFEIWICYSPQMHFFTSKVFLILVSDGYIVRSSSTEVFCKKETWKFRKTHGKTPVSEHLF